jgi:hypothetical protein
VVELDLPGVKRLFLGLEKKVQNNLFQRVKFADEPAKFLDAELELYEEIGNFKVSEVDGRGWLEWVGGSVVVFGEEGGGRWAALDCSRRGGVAIDRSTRVAPIPSPPFFHSPT